MASEQLTITTRVVDRASQQLQQLRQELQQLEQPRNVEVRATIQHELREFERELERITGASREAEVIVRVNRDDWDAFRRDVEEPIERRCGSIYRGASGRPKTWARGSSGSFGRPSRSYRASRSPCRRAGWVVLLSRGWGSLRRVFRAWALFLPPQVRRRLRLSAPVWSPLPPCRLCPAMRPLWGLGWLPLHPCPHNRP